MKKPMIALIPLVDAGRDSLWMLPGYLNGISAAGGIGVMLPLTGEEGDIDEILSRFDGFLFTGGHDVDPALYGQENLHCGELAPGRDVMERKLLLGALERKKPVFGICRGLQLMNAVLGGTLYQDIPTLFPSDTNHRMAAPYGRAEHTVDILPGTPFAQWQLGPTIGVNSCHHQAVDRLGEGLKLTAYCPEDQVVEAFTHECLPVFAVQWHPEKLSGNWLREDAVNGIGLMEYFIRLCKENTK